MKILSINEFKKSKAVNEGAGAGYEVTLEGVALDTKSALFTGESKFDMKRAGKPEYIFFNIDIEPCIINRWKAQDYYYGISSDNEDDSNFYFNNDEDKTINGGTSTWFVDKQEFIEFVKANLDLNNIEMKKLLNTKPDKNKNSIWNKCLAKIFTDFVYAGYADFEFDFSSGYIHKNLDDVISCQYDITDQFWSEFSLIEVDYATSFLCNGFKINAPNISQDINYYFEHCDDVDNDDDEDDDFKKDED